MADGAKDKATQPKITSWADASDSEEEEEEEIVMPPIEQPRRIPSLLGNKEVSSSSSSYYGPARRTNSITSNSSNPEQAGPSRGDEDSLTVMVGNLNPGCTELMLGELFSTKGNCRIRSVRIPRSNDRGPRGMAFIEMEDRASVESALRADGFTGFQDKPIRVSIARSQPGRSYDSTSSSSRGGGGGRGGGRGGPPQHHSREEVRPVHSSALMKTRIEPRVEAKPIQIPESILRSTSSAPVIPHPAPVPSVRPKLDLKPRTAPIDSTAVITPAAAIFGGGRPRDETVAKVADALNVNSCLTGNVISRLYVVEAQ